MSLPLEGGGEFGDEGGGGEEEVESSALNAVNDSNAAWDYAKLNANKILGFDVAQGPYIIEANTLTPAPGFFNLKQRHYLWLKLKINDTFVGEFYEYSSQGIFEGPYFAKILLVNSGIEKLAYSLENSGSYTFQAPTTIHKMTFELIDPIMGTVVDRHDTQGKEWDFELSLFK
jgi:hypothetical protein